MVARYNARLTALPLCGKGASLMLLIFFTNPVVFIFVADV